MNKTTVMAILLASLFVASVSYANCGNGNGNGNGCSDVPGPQGPQGNQGVDGINGKDGANGASGAQGVAGLNGTNGKDATSQARLLGEVDIRLWDTKHTSFYVFDSYGFNDGPSNDVVMDGRNAFYGGKFVVKFGSSYEGRMIDKQAAQIKALEAALAKLSK